uniref:Putative secreted protein n=1 Tax=Ixodes ricinus TaxID=34613 RepID=A0A6B0UNT4_IXORI
MFLLAYLGSHCLSLCHSFKGSRATNRRSKDLRFSSQSVQCNPLITIMRKPRNSIVIQSNFVNSNPLNSNLLIIQTNMKVPSYASLWKETPGNLLYANKFSIPLNSNEQDLTVTDNHGIWTGD